MIKNSIVLLLVLMIGTSCTSNAQKVDIAITQFKEGISKPDVQVLDVRTQAEYNSGHLKNAFLADWTQPKVFEERIKSLDKNRPVYTYCLSGGRSSAAAEKLRQQGFKEVYNMEGGMMAWKAAQMPVEGTPTTKPISMEEYIALIPSDRTVLVDIGAVWCPPCKKMEPVIADLVQNNKNSFELVIIDGGAQERLAGQLEADTFPTFIIYKKGKETWRQSGLVSKEILLQQLQ